jgi:chemotaxis protein methyltransferase WspC
VNDIENLLRHSIGLHAATIGSSVVEHTVRSRMRQLGLGHHEDYLNLLRKSPAEWNNLVETMVVTETWFFREKQPFTAMIRLVVEQWLPTHPEGVLRLLSVPCSSGEEPYSMAMALMDAGVPAARFTIDAVDISARALAFARRAVYGKNSFRGADLDFRDRYFRSISSGYSLNPAVKKQVRFWRGNLLHENCLGESAVYNFVFCRNLLIYFDRPTQDRTLAKLHGLLASEGVLFTAPAELPVALDNGFKALDLPLGFACRKTNQVAARQLDGRISKNGPTAGPAHQATQAGAPHSADGLRPLEPGERGRLPSGLEVARQLADAGHLAEAAEICESHLREQGVSAEAFYVLGLVRDAAGADAQAGEFYRKALYLEPGHCDTLRQWASLSERNGRSEHARILRERAARRSNGKTSEL